MFISYSHKDNEHADSSKRWLDRLREHLEPLVQQDNITVCSDQEIGLGDDWHTHIQTHVDGASAAVLLVSPAFLASKYIRSSEQQKCPAPPRAGSRRSRFTFYRR